MSVKLRKNRISRFILQRKRFIKLVPLQNMMLGEEQIRDSLVKECSTKVAIFSSTSGELLAADPGYFTIKELTMIPFSGADPCSTLGV